MQINLVRDYAVREQNKQTDKTYSSTQLTKLSTPKDTISFGSHLDDDVEIRANEKKPKSYNMGDEVVNFFKWDVFGGKEKAIGKAKDEIFKENQQREIQAAVDKATIENHQKLFEEMDKANKETKQARIKAEEAFAEAGRAKDETIIHQGKSLEATQKLADERENQAQRFKELLEEQKLAQAKHDAESKALAEKLQEALDQKNLEHIAQLRQQREEMQGMHEEHIKLLSSKMTDVSQIEKTFEAIANKNNLNGFARIAGYDQHKEILTNQVGHAVGLEKSNKPTKVPNGIMFFGPKGSGKTTFGEALAGQLGCNLVKVKNYTNDEKNMGKLYTAAEQAEESYKKDGKRTILLINEFDIFAKGEKMTGALKDFMDSVSKDYHCTVFATTNFPETIDDILLRDGRFDTKVGLPPADKANAKAVLMHHSKGLVDESVNYDELTEHIVKCQPEEAFSNSRIKSSVLRLAITATDKKIADKKITHNDLFQSIKEIGPDIAKDAMKLFKKQIEHMKKI